MMTEDEAVETARAYARKEGWPWLTPIECRRKSGWFCNSVYVVRTNKGRRGANVIAIIDEVTGDIIESHFLRR